MKENKNCDACAHRNSSHLVRLGLAINKADFIIAVAGNPNTGKSTVFNNLTGLRQHTGNWPGKTVSSAVGTYSYGGKQYQLVDLPGTYSLLSTSTEEEIARNFILFEKPDVTVIVADATRLERNLNLILQILEITDHAVLCLNLIDEAKRNNIEIDIRILSRALGIPVIATDARKNIGMNELIASIHEVATENYICQPHRIKFTSAKLSHAIGILGKKIAQQFPTLPNPRWVAVRLLEGDQRIAEAIQTQELLHLGREMENVPPTKSVTHENFEKVLKLVTHLRWEIGFNFQDRIIEEIYVNASKIAKKTVIIKGEKKAYSVDRQIDKALTSRWLGFPIMFLVLALVFWVTIAGANYPSALLSSFLIDTVHPILKNTATDAGIPWWLTGAIIDGAYMAVAWVVSVMLPPMAIFFPLFTLLEDLGYLPRIAFNMDSLFRKVGTHGKQALTLSMGFGCNAAGVIAARIIDSPRERLIAIITNNFSLCNGRWPTQILIATLFIGSTFPAYMAGFVSAGAVVGIAVLGIFFSLVVSWLLSRTILKGESSFFSLELPPYRPPRILRTLYTSLIDRTIFVLWRAVIFAAPAGIVIWAVANIQVEGVSIAEYFINWSDPFAILFGLNGIILLAYIIAIPANEIVIPTILMLTVVSTGLTDMGEGAGVMLEAGSNTKLILEAGGWTALTGINVMLFSLLHNPCSTTLYTIYKETKSVKWSLVSAFLPLAMGFIVCFFVTQFYLLFSNQF